MICLLASAFLIGCGGGLKNESAQSGGSLPTPLNPTVPTAPQNPQTQLALSVSSVNFGQVAVGTKSVISEIDVVNQSAVSVPEVYLSLPAGPFILTATTCEATIPANGGCKLNLQFVPTTSGPADVTATIMGASQPATISLSGAGMQPENLASSVSTISFSNTESGSSSSSIVLSVQNTGGIPSEAIQTIVPDQFVATTNSCSDVVLLPSQQCSISLTFAPASIGRKTGSLVIQDAQERLSVALSGVAVSVIPTLNSTIPSTFQVGQNVTVALSGSNLNKLGQLLFNGSAINFTIISPTQVTFPLTVPSSISGTVQLVGVSSDAGGGNSLPLVIPLQVPAITYDAAVRFLQQASFGPTPSSVATVQAQGFAPWVDQQMSNASFDYTAAAVQGPGFFYRNTQNDSYSLRQRVGFALSQIFVSQYYGPDWENLLEKDSFGNARTLLQDVTESSMMGQFLDNMDNYANLPYALPDQNFARELMQVMTIGIVQLNNDGSQKLDLQGNPLPNYSQDNIAAMAAAFSGWLEDPASAAAEVLNPLTPMVPNNGWHDQGPKQILPNVLLPAGQGVVTDTNSALDAIFQHPSFPPFLAFRLIQHLVKSNPSPAYIQRMSMVLENDGTGTRGNIGALVKAILLDPEARIGDDPTTTDDSAGHYMEPILYISSVMKVVGGVFTDDQVRDTDSSMAESLYNPPSVFSYYSPLHQLPDGTYAPDVQLLDDNHGMVKLAFIYNLLHGSIGGLYVDLSQSPFWDSPSSDNLLDLMNHLLFHGQMSTAMHNTLQDYIAANQTQPLNSLLPDLLFMVLQSSSYQVIR
jgi:hypothetical protein